MSASKGREGNNYRPMRQIDVCPVPFQSEALIGKGFAFLVLLKPSDSKGLKALLRKKETVPPNCSNCIFIYFYH